MQNNSTTGNIEFAPRCVECRDCGEFFILSPGERQFYFKMQYTEPTRCPDCRARHKAQMQKSAGTGKGGASNG